jgi:hypothetical protein
MPQPEDSNRVARCARPRRAVGEEIDLHALPLEQLKKTALGFLVIDLNPGKATFDSSCFPSWSRLKAKMLLPATPRTFLAYTVRGHSQR